MAEPEQLEYDPRQIRCPDFANAAYDLIRDAMVSSANLPKVTSNEQAIQKLQDDWEVANAPLRAQYELQLRANEERAEQERQREEETQRLREEEQRQREGETAKEIEKKRAPLYDFTEGVGAKSIQQQIHPHARKLITARKFVPLWYFLPEALKEAKERNRDTVDTNRFQLATDDESGLTLLGTHSTRASANAIPDAKLSWAQVSLAKSSYLAALPLGNYPPKFITMFARFYANMDMHPELHEDNGNQVMAHYHSEMRRSWYEQNERGEPFDLSVIAERVLDESRREVQKRINAKAINGQSTLQLKIIPPLMQSTFPFPSSPLLFIITMDHNATATLLNATTAMYDNATTATYATQQLAMTATFNHTLNA